MPAKKRDAKLIQIGYITKPHGLKGEVNAVFNYPQYPDKIARLRHLFMGDAANPIPYLIENIYPSGKKTFYLTAEGVDSRSKAEELAGAKMFVPQDVFDKVFAEKDTLAPGLLIGFKAIDTKEKELGIIEDVFEMPQILAQVFINGKEALLPVNESTIVKIDKRNKTILLELPDGLLDIF